MSNDPKHVDIRLIKKQLDEEHAERVKQEAANPLPATPPTEKPAAPPAPLPSKKE